MSSAAARADAVPPLAGREREQAALRAALDAALAGRGGLVLIGGEAGIGKTALAEWALAEAQARGALALVGRCYDLAETPPYGPWAEALARAPRGGDLVGPPDLGGAGAASQAALFGQVRDYLAALTAGQPLVALLDDLHWADPASLELLRFLGRGLGERPLLVLATYRSDELTRRHPLYQLLPPLVREARAARLDLHPLEEGDLRALTARYALPVRDADRLAAYLAARTEGNPFFAGELLRALEEGRALRRDGGGWRLGDLAGVGVPPLLRQVLDARLDRLGEEARALLAVAAVVGQEVPFAVWQMVAEADEGALLATVERATAAHLLADLPGGEGARFPHALVREALYEGLVALRRRALHRRAGEALAALPSPDPDAVAYHLQRAGDARAVEWLVRAGERAHVAYAFLTAIERYEAALALLEGAGDDPVARGWLRYRVARLLRFSAPRRGVEYLDEALRSAEAAGDRALAAAARYSRGLCWYFAAEHQAAIADMAAGCDALEALPPEELARLDLGPDERGVPTVTNPRGWLVDTLAEVGRLAEALAMGEGLREGVPRRTLLGELAWAHHGDRQAGLGTAYALAGRPGEARAAWAEARAIFRAHDHYSPLAGFTYMELVLVALPYHADRPADYRRLAAEATAARARASTSGTLPVRVADIPVLALGGRWAEARAAAEAILAPGANNQGGLSTRPELGALLRAQGEPGAAWELIRPVLPEGPATPPGDTGLFYALALQRLAADLALDAGDLPQARDWLDAHDRWLAWSGAVLGRAEGHLGWAAYHRAAADPAAARRHADRALAAATEPRQPLALLATHRLLGELDTESGQHEEARVHLDAALALAEACEAPYERALTLLALAELRAAERERDGAAATLGEARALLAPLGARPALALADALAARLDAGAGSRPGAAPATVPDAPAPPFGLTAREAEVLRLVTRGLTNAQVADRLFVTPRTVNAHLTSIYGKLGVENRAAAVRLALDHGLR